MREPGLLTRVLAVARGQRRTRVLELMRDAGAGVYDELSEAERTRTELLLAGRDLWTAPPHLSGHLLATWNAFVLHALGAGLLAAGFLPRAAFALAQSWFTAAEHWLSEARQARSNPDYDIATRIDLPADPPPWPISARRSRAHLAAMLAAIPPIREHADLALYDLERCSDTEARQRAVNTLRQLAASAATAAEYAAAAGPDGADELGEVIEGRLQHALVTWFHIGQLAARPALVEGYRPPPAPVPGHGSRPRPATPAVVGTVIALALAAGVAVPVGASLLSGRDPAPAVTGAAPAASQPPERPTPTSSAAVTLDSGPAGGVSDLAFSPDGALLAVYISLHDEHRLELWNVASRTRVGTAFPSGGTAIADFAFSVDGQALVTSDGDGTLRLWDVAHGEQLAEPVGGGSAGLGVALSRDGAMLATADLDGNVWLWDVARRQRLDRPLALKDSFYTVALAFSADRTMLAVGYADGTIQLWDVASRRLVDRTFDHRDWVDDLAFSPDGTTLASGGRDSLVSLWDIESGRSIGGPLPGHLSGINDLAFSPDSTTLASVASSDSTVRLWDAGNAQPAAEPIDCGSGSVSSVAFNPDGEALAAGCFWATQLWPLPDVG